MNLKSIYHISVSELTRPGAIVAKKQFSKYPLLAPGFGWQPQNPSVFICKDCDYYGICPEVDRNKINAFKASLGKNNIKIIKKKPK